MDARETLRRALLLGGGLVTAAVGAHAVRAGAEAVNESGVLKPGLVLKAASLASLARSLPGLTLRAELDRAEISVPEGLSLRDLPGAFQRLFGEQWRTLGSRAALVLAFDQGSSRVTYRIRYTDRGFSVEEVA